MNRAFEFMRIAAMSPRSTGALFPSSRPLVLAMVEGIEFDYSNRIVEFGCGLGDLTMEIQFKTMCRGGYLGVESNPKFLARLKADFPVMELTDYLLLLTATATHVLSSVPVSRSENIASDAWGELKPGGMFRCMQYLHMWPFGAKFRSHVCDGFGPMVSRKIVWSNLPPMVVMTWIKP